jgi:hypothetical protein
MPNNSIRSTSYACSDPTKEPALIVAICFQVHRKSSGIDLVDLILYCRTI